MKLGLRVLSRSDVPFRDSEEAAQLLCDELEAYRASHPVILGIPRGGLLLASELSRLLNADLDVMMTHKVPSEKDREVAVGAVTECGRLFVERSNSGSIGDTYLHDEKNRQLTLLHSRLDQYRKALPRIPLQGRVVIVTDDGVATGFTMKAALWAARQQHPARLVAAVPVAPETVLKELSLFADETVCLKTPPLFYGVGQFYEDFGPVEDRDLMRLLEAGRKGGGPSHGEPIDPKKQGAMGPLQRAG